MRLIIESPNEVKGSINEGSNDFYIEGVFATIDTKNVNGRVYSREIWRKAIEEYQKHITKPTTYSLMEWEHSDDTTVNPMNAVAKIESLYIDGMYVMGKAKLLNNPKAEVLKDIINTGIPIAVSSRGVGDLDPMGNVIDYSLITFDCVTDPSDKSAYLSKSKNPDFKNGIYMKESYERSPSGHIIISSKNAGDTKEETTQQNITGSNNDNDDNKYPIGDIMKVIKNL